jgi:crotonobetainyl-CoA:carnitine CoA-transferase CaiB-like acyl-CoA transferase
MALAPGYIADKVSAIIATQGVLAALLARSKTGRGAIVDVSMLDALAYFNAPDALAGYLLSDPAPEVMEHVSAVRPLQTADGFLVVSPVSGDQLRALVGAVGHPEWADELRACRSPVDMIHRMNELLEGVLRDRSTASWLDAFAHADVPASSLLTPAEHLADKQVAFNELYYCIQDSTLGEIRRPRHPALFNGRPAESDRLQVPVLQTDRSVGN